MLCSLLVKNYAWLEGILDSIFEYIPILSEPKMLCVTVRLSAGYDVIDG